PRRCTWPGWRTASPTASAWPAKRWTAVRRGRRWTATWRPPANWPRRCRRRERRLRPASGAAVLRGGVQFAAQRRGPGGVRRRRGTHARTGAAAARLPGRRVGARRRWFRHHRVLLAERGGDRRLARAGRARRDPPAWPPPLVHALRTAGGPDRARLRLCGRPR